ncbi:Zinc finger protein ZAT2 [Zea mays]|uniref:Zinc finger protein ZAT2 n=1 Tax=Zea mays TaxID=4577 RepID=A0A3L6FVG4_MAIZE|nr:Zinc finger protein ZAT2 [Zea mays]
MCESLTSLMPPSPPPSPPEYKHFCRVCNKGFTCGSALGGHMRAHGPASDVDGFGVVDDDDGSLDEEGVTRCPGADEWDDAVGTSATHAYALRANPNRLIRSCQLCKNCGKEFTSLELFLQHARCSSSEDEGGGEEEQVDGPVPSSSSPPTNADGGGDEDPILATPWSKGKRSRRVGTTEEDPSTSTVGEEEDLAKCLVMLSSSKSNINDQEANVIATITKDDHHHQKQPIPFFTQSQESVVAALPSSPLVVPQYISPAPRGGVFECKACKKVFTSHQALGGHRASHKKVKGCFAAKFETSNATESTRHHQVVAVNIAKDGRNNDNGKAPAVDEIIHAGASASASAHVPGGFATTIVDTNIGTSSDTPRSLYSMALAPIVEHNPLVETTLAVAAAQFKKSTKMHECSVCHRLFTSGQALGGHKRCHWLTSNTSDPCNTVTASMIPSLTEDFVGGVVKQQFNLQPQPMVVDVPPPVLDLTIAPNATVAHLQPLAVAAPSNVNHQKKDATRKKYAIDAVMEEEEADSTPAKRAKISDLKDMVSMDGEPTKPWLQVGIGSSSAPGDDS